MSISKKLLLFVFILVVIPMLILFFISNYIFENHVENAAQGYLENAIKLARIQMFNRLKEIEKACRLITQSPNFQKAVLEENISEIKQVIKDITKVYDYLDFYIILDKENRLLASQPNINNNEFTRLDKLIEKARISHNIIVSEEVFQLSELFYSNSDDYNKYKVKISNDTQDENTSKYFTKCLLCVSVAPVYNKSNNQLVGFFIAGDIVNNDNYFPRVYSENVENSYLAISTDGIRVTSNICSPKKGNFIGSLIPISMDTLEGPKDSYFGRVNIDNEIHVFLDEPIIDIDGNVIGTLGVGIPEHKFSIIMDTNRNIIIIVTISCLLIMLFIGRYVANRITLPIYKATELAERISQGKNDLVIDEQFLKDEKSETTILLKTFQKMAEDLKYSEEERKNYFKKLQQKHKQQQELAKQLKLLNDELERKVEARTQDLRQAIIVLKKADEVKSRFLANMSHELRTPLNAIISSSEVLKEEILGSLNEKQQRYIQNILKSSTHLLQLINDILDISKIEAGKMTLSLGYYSISNIVMESFSIVKSLAYRKNIEVSINIVPPDFKIKVDAKKLKQILYNLLSNAIKFTPENGKVTVDVFKGEQFMQVSVKDNGIGIKEEDQEKVFREFEQVDNSYERHYEGTGLGLPLTKKLVEMHGGEIYLVSKFGEGTEAIISLPINIDENINGSTQIT